MVMKIARRVGFATVSSEFVSIRFRLAVIRSAVYVGRL